MQYDALTQEFLKHGFRPYHKKAKVKPQLYNIWESIWFVIQKQILQKYTSRYALENHLKMHIFCASLF